MWIWGHCIVKIFQILNTACHVGAAYNMARNIAEIVSSGGEGQSTGGPSEDTFRYLHMRWSTPHYKASEA